MDPELAGQLRDADSVALGLRIRNQRLARGLTQPQLADGKVTVGYISRIESGDRRPDVELLEHFAMVLETTPFYLVTGADPQEVEQWTLSVLSAELALETGSTDEARRLLDELLDPANVLPEEVRRRAKYLHARCFEVVGAYDDAIMVLEELTSAPIGVWTARPLIALSRCYLESGDIARAIDVAEAGLARLGEAGIDGGDDAIRLSVTLASAYFYRGDAGHAVRIARDAAQRAEAAQSPEAQAAAYWNASVFESERGALSQAIDLARHALELLSVGEDRRNRARLRAELGLLLLRVDPPEYNEAQRCLKRARRELSASSGSLVDLASCDVGLAEASLHAGDFETATEYATAAYAAVQVKAPLVAAGALRVLGRSAAAAGDMKGARATYQDAIAILTGVGQDRSAAQLWLELGSELEEIGEAEAARDAYRRAAVASGLQMPSALRKQAPKSGR